MTRAYGPADVTCCRTAIGMTQFQFANLAGVTVRTVRRWELGDTPVPEAAAACLDAARAAFDHALADMEYANVEEGRFRRVRLKPPMPRRGPTWPDDETLNVLATRLWAESNRPGSPVRVRVVRAMDGGDYPLAPKLDNQN